MRLSTQERKGIVEVIHSYDPKAKVYLYGSRADDALFGGDIDLLIMSQQISEKQKRHLRLDLFDRIGEQKLDLVIAQDDSDPFVKLALKKGVLL